MKKTNHNCIYTQEECKQINASGIGRIVECETCKLGNQTTSNFKRHLKGVFTVLIVTIGIMLLISNTHRNLEAQNDNTRGYAQMRDVMFDIIITDTNKIDVHIADWHIFLNAMMYVESRGDPLAVGKTNDAGVLQLTPIYVKEANRVLGENRFTLADRFDKYKSIEMFSIINEKYNPERSFYKAMRLHNPNAPDSYRKAILTQYYKLRNK